VSAAHFIWLPDGHLGKRVWRAALLHGYYEIDQATLAAWFIRHPLTSRADGEMMPIRFTSVTEAQGYCEQHWYLTVCKKIAHREQQR
jgi:hypothetical protein